MERSAEVPVTPADAYRGERPRAHPVASVLGFLSIPLMAIASFGFKIPYEAPSNAPWTVYVLVLVGCLWEAHIVQLRTGYNAERRAAGSVVRLSAIAAVFALLLRGALPSYGPGGDWYALENVLFLGAIEGRSMRSAYAEGQLSLADTAALIRPTAELLPPSRDFASVKLIRIFPDGRILIAGGKYHQWAVIAVAFRPGEDQYGRRTLLATCHSEPAWMSRGRCRALEEGR